MAWTASIVQKGIQGKSLLVNISYTNGALQFNEVLDMTGMTLQQYSDIISARLATLEITQTLFPQVTTGPFAPVIAAPAPVPTADQIAQTKFFTDVNLLRAMKNAIALGIKKDTDTDYLAQLALVISEFIPSYLSLM